MRATIVMGALLAATMALAVAGGVDIAPVSLPEAWDRLRAGWPGGAPPAWMKGQAND